MTHGTPTPQALEALRIIKDEYDRDMMDKVIEIRIQDLKESIVKAKMANSEGNVRLVDIYCLTMVTQLKSLEHRLLNNNND